jgi:anti-sigma factor RsiW
MKCEHAEELLSGYLDNELALQQRQLTERHLQECATCQAVLEDLKMLRERTRDLSYEEATRKEWDVVERSILQSLTRSLGWMIIIVWAVVTSGYGMFHFATSPTEPLFEKIVVFGMFLGFGLLFLSVLTQRIREGRTDRYKGVHK